MSARTVLAALASIGLLIGSTRMDAHRLDEYLQATLLSTDGDRVRADIALTPGANMAREIFASIDVDADGRISDREADAYARRVLADVSLSIDGRPATLALEQRSFPNFESMRLGIGTIRLRAAVEVRPTGSDHALIYHNSHRSDASVYLVNVLAPADRRVHMSALRRDALQHSVAFEYGVASDRWRGEAGWLLAAVALIGGTGMMRRRRCFIGEGCWW